MSANYLLIVSNQKTCIHFNCNTRPTRISFIGNFFILSININDIRSLYQLCQPLYRWTQEGTFYNFFSIRKVKETLSLSGLDKVPKIPIIAYHPFFSANYCLNFYGFKISKIPIIWAYFKKKYLMAPTYTIKFCKKNHITIGIVYIS